MKLNTLWQSGYSSEWTHSFCPRKVIILLALFCRHPLFIKWRIRQHVIARGNVHMWATMGGFVYGVLNKLRLRQNGCHFTVNILRYIFFNERVSVSIKISFEIVLGSNWQYAIIGSDNGLVHLASSHYLNQCWPFHLMHICVSFSLNELRHGYCIGNYHWTLSLWENEPTNDKETNWLPTFQPL